MRLFWAQYIYIYIYKLYRIIFISLRGSCGSKPMYSFMVIFLSLAREVFKRGCFLQTGGRTSSLPLSSAPTGELTESYIVTFYNALKLPSLRIYQKNPDKYLPATSFCPGMPRPTSLRYYCITACVHFFKLVG